MQIRVAQMALPGSSSGQNARSAWQPVPQLPPHDHNAPNAAVHSPMTRALLNTQHAYEAARLLGGVGQPSARLMIVDGRQKLELRILNLQPHASSLAVFDSTDETLEARKREERRHLFARVGCDGQHW